MWLQVELKKTEEPDINRAVQGALEWVMNQESLGGWLEKAIQECQKSSTVDKNKGNLKVHKR